MKTKARKPRRWWATIQPDGSSWGVYDSKQVAKKYMSFYAGTTTLRLIRVEEILPKPRKKVKR